MEKNWVLYYFDPADNTDNPTNSGSYITAAEALSVLNIDQINGGDGCGYFALNILTGDIKYPKSMVIY